MNRRGTTEVWLPLAVRAAFALLLTACVGCQKHQANELAQTEKDQIAQLEIQRIAEEKASVMFAEQARKEELAQIEAVKIAEERARQQELAHAKRAELAFELEERRQKRLAQEAFELEKKISEQQRRDITLENLRNFVDMLEISESSVNKVLRLTINGDEIKGTKVAIPVADGSTLLFKGKEGDYYLFEYSEPAFSAYFKRKQRGISFASFKDRDGLASNIARIEDAGPQELNVGSGELSGAISKSNPLPVSIRSANKPVNLGSGILLLEAKWGANASWANVETFIATLIQSGKASFSASSSNLGGDSAPGQVKTLRIRWMNNGRIGENEWREGQTVDTSSFGVTSGREALRSASLGPVTILNAQYGAGNVWRDVRGVLKTQASDGRISIDVGNHSMGGDPIFGVVKVLKVKYSVSGRIYERAWTEGQQASIP